MTEPTGPEPGALERTRFLAVARHKLKTPLAVMAGWASTLDKWELLTEEERAHGLAAIQRATTDLQHQIEDVLDEARSDLLSRALRPVDIELASFLSETVSGMDIDQTTHPTTVDADAGAAALADPDALVQVVAHLVDNARKYSPDGGRIQVVARAGRTVRIEVRDRGIGLGHADGIDLFAPFERGFHAVTATRGTGLGLHVVRMLVEAMGGAVSLAPAEGGGTRATVELPAP